MRTIALLAAVLVPSYAVAAPAPELRLELAPAAVARPGEPFPVSLRLSGSTTPPAFGRFDIHVLRDASPIAWSDGEPDRAFYDAVDARDVRADVAYGPGPTARVRIDAPGIYLLVAEVPAGAAGIPPEIAGRGLVSRGIVVRVAVGAAGATATREPEAAPAPEQTPAAADANAAGEQDDEPVVRVGGDVRAPEPIKSVQPKYPAEAKAAHLQGIVVVEAVIERSGAVSEVRVVSGDPLLAGAAVEAARQFTFRPGTRAGKPVRVLFTSTFNFSLK